MTPELCLTCGNFPCTCGNQYNSLTNAEYLALLSALRTVGCEKFGYKSIDMKLDGNPLDNVINNIPKGQDFVFTQEIVETLPPTWVRALKSCKEMDCVADAISALSKYSTDDIEFPSGLIMSVLVKCNLPNRTLVHLLKSWLKSRNDVISGKLHQVLDDKAEYIKTSVNQISSFILGISSLTDANSYYNVSMKKAATYLNRLLLSIERNDINGTSFNLECLMLIICDSSDVISNSSSLVIDDANNEIGTRLYYIDESFREYIAGNPISNLPQLKVTP